MVCQSAVSVFPYYCSYHKGLLFVIATGLRFDGVVMMSETEDGSEPRDGKYATVSTID